MTATHIRHPLDATDISENTIPADCRDCRAARGYTTPREYAQQQAYYCAGCNSEWWLDAPIRSAYSWRKRLNTSLWLLTWLSGIIAITLFYALVYGVVVLQGHYSYWAGLGITLAIAWACLMTWIIWGQLLWILIDLGERLLNWLLGAPLREDV